MFVRRCEGLRPLFVFGLLAALAGGASAQIAPASSWASKVAADVSDWSDFVGTSPEPLRTGPLDEAAFAVLRQGGPWTEQDHRPLTQAQRELMRLAKEGQWAATLTLLKQGVEQPDARDLDGATLLTLAARAGELQVVRELLRRGADGDRSGLHGQTPLGAAASAGHDLVVQDLLRAGARVSLPGAGGQSALHLAARGGHLKAMRQLIQAGADVHAVNQGGRHALAEAALFGQTEAMALLVQAGVSASEPDQQGLNALHAAALGDQAEAVQWLRARSVPVPHPLTQVLIDNMGQRPLDAR